MKFFQLINGRVVEEIELHDDIKCKDSQPRVVVGDVYLGLQNSQSLHTRLVKGDATYEISNHHQQGGTYTNVLGTYDHIIPLSRASEYINKCVQNGSP
jgi:hypothetical protein